MQIALTAFDEDCPEHDRAHSLQRLTRAEAHVGEWEFLCLRAEMHRARLDNVSQRMSELESVEGDKNDSDEDQAHQNHMPHRGFEPLFWP